MEKEYFKQYESDKNYQVQAHDSISSLKKSLNAGSNWWVSKIPQTPKTNKWVAKKHDKPENPLV